MCTKDDFYKRLGLPFCWMLNVALAMKGGPEMVVISLYSFITSQKMEGEQSSGTLIDCTKVVDSCVPAEVAVQSWSGAWRSGG